MTQKDQQLEHLHDAVERKKRESEEASRAHPAPGGPPPADDGRGTQSGRFVEGRNQDGGSVRDKNSRKGKVTADKWNQ